MKRRQSGKRARSRRAIMHAARDLFEEKGIEHVTFNDIAMESNMCRTTIFNHFATINDLIYALIEEEVESIVSYSKECGISGGELIDDLFRRMITDTVKYPVLSCKLVANAVIRGEKSGLSRLEDILRDNLPELSDEEKDDRIVLLTGFYYGLVNHYFINGKEFNADRMYEQFIRMAAPYIYR